MGFKSSQLLFCIIVSLDVINEMDDCLLRRYLEQTEIEITAVITSFAKNLSNVKEMSYQKTCRN